jgi:hypothetical protein
LSRQAREPARAKDYLAAGPLLSNRCCDGPHFLIIALVALFGFTDVASASASIAQVLFGIFRSVPGRGGARDGGCAPGAGARTPPLRRRRRSGGAERLDFRSKRLRFRPSTGERAGLMRAAQSEVINDTAKLI